MNQDLCSIILLSLFLSVINTHGENGKMQTGNLSQLNITTMDKKDKRKLPQELAKTDSLIRAKQHELTKKTFGSKSEKREIKTTIANLNNQFKNSPQNPTRVQRKK